MHERFELLHPLLGGAALVPACRVCEAVDDLELLQAHGLAEHTDDAAEGVDVDEFAADDVAEVLGGRAELLEEHEEVATRAEGEASEECHHYLSSGQVPRIESREGILAFAEDLLVREEDSRRSVEHVAIIDVSVAAHLDSDQARLLRQHFLLDDVAQLGRQVAEVCRRHGCDGRCGWSQNGLGEMMLVSEVSKTAWCALWLLRRKLMFEEVTSVRRASRRFGRLDNGSGRLEFVTCSRPKVNGDQETELGEDR